VYGVLPPYRYAQADLTDLVADLCLFNGDGRALLDRVHSNVQVQARQLVMPAQRYAELDGFSAANDVFVEAGLDLAEEAVRGALDRADVAANEVDVIASVSVTGIAAPSLEARLVPRLGLRADVVRVPVFGCPRLPAHTECSSPWAPASPASSSCCAGDDEPAADARVAPAPGATF
jgi:alkylresorcinol/alkylpyrone synthase